MNAQSILVNPTEKINPNGQPRPKRTKVLAENIPAEMKAANRWTLWKWSYRPDDNKPWTKVAYQTNNCKAASNDPTTWTSFDKAWQIYQKRQGYDGIGFMLGDGWTGIDLDGALDDSPQARKLNSLLTTYCERSVSGTGLHWIVGGEISPDHLQRKHGWEFYDDRRFFTVTGWRVADCDHVADCPDLATIHAEIMPERPQQQESLSAPAGDVDVDVADILDVAWPDDKFRRLYYWGDSSDYGNDHNRPDMALAGKLLSYCDGDRELADRAFRSSALNRDKWEGRKDYRDRTFNACTVKWYYGWWLYKVDPATVVPCVDPQPEDPTLNEPDSDLPLPDDVETYDPALEEGRVADPHKYRFAPIWAADFAKADYRRDWLVKRVLTKNEPCIVGGPSKTLKTSLLVDLAISLGSGLPLLGEYEVIQPTRTVLVSGESGEATLQETALRVAKAKGIALGKTICGFDFRLPKLAVDEEIESLTAGLRQNAVEVVIIDPLYLCLLSDSDKQASNVYDMGPLLLRVSKACLDVGTQPILSHHSKKTIQHTDPLDLGDLAFSGIQEFARQWWLVNRRRPYVRGSGWHDLWLSWGGSAGHSGVVGLDVDEGQLADDFSGRGWDVVLREYEDIQQERQQEREAKKNEKDYGLEAELLCKLDELAPVTKNSLKTALGWGSKINRIVQRLIDRGVIKIITQDAGNGRTAEHIVRS